MFGFEGTNNVFSGMAQWLSWLERRPVTAKVVGSSPIWVVKGLFNPCGVLAQLGEHLPYKQRVIGSSPIGPIYICGEIAQLARACGSYPQCHRFKSSRRYHTGEMRQHLSGIPLERRPVGQEVKTRPFHGCNMGSIPVRVTMSAPRGSPTIRRLSSAG